MPKAHNLTWSQIPCVNDPVQTRLLPLEDRSIYEELNAITEPSSDMVLMHLDFVSERMADTFESPDQSNKK